MEKAIVKGLNDKLYEKRKNAASDLEKQVKQCILSNDFNKIDEIVTELCEKYAYALHNPTARNAGLMGLAATAIALGSAEMNSYLERIVPPVLACFGDQNEQVRFYACESLYNIAKIAKGEILVFFNEIFDVLCKISADSDTSVRGAAELMDRLMKDIVAERASSYISIIKKGPADVPKAHRLDPVTGNMYQEPYDQHEDLAFSLPKFIPLLTERIYVVNPDTRIFLVDWIRVLLDTPGLELISFLPFFLGGLFTYLGDTHKDVRIVTKSLLNQLLKEMQRIVEIQTKLRNSKVVKEDHDVTKANIKTSTLIEERRKTLLGALDNTEEKNNLKSVDETAQDDTEDTSSEKDENEGAEYIPDQDIQLNFKDTIQILINNLTSSEREIQYTAIQWLEAILKWAPEVFITYLAKLLSVLLKFLSKPDYELGALARSLNTQLVNICNEYDHRENENAIEYGSIVNSLTLQFFDSDVETKIACLDWLILIYQKAPNQILGHSEGMFLTLLKSLSNDDDKLIESALTLLQNICSDSNDSYLEKFLTDFLILLRRDEKLLKTRTNYIMRQICSKLEPERTYRVVSQILDKIEDPIFVRIMTQILSTNLVKSRELHPLRQKFRNQQDTSLFQNLFKLWCHNPVSVISLCLISESYELAYSILQSFANYEINLADLVQLDILVQLFESPIFTRMRTQLLEQQKYPYLYKTLYAILMILPQSKAFELLNTRLSSVNVWISQSNNSFYKHRNISSEISDASINVINQSKLGKSNLVDYFDKMLEREYTVHALDDLKESDLVVYGLNSLKFTTHDNTEVRGTASISYKSADDESLHNATPVPKKNGTSEGIPKKLSGKLKRFGAVAN